MSVRTWWNDLMAPSDEVEAATLVAETDALGDDHLANCEDGQFVTLFGRVTQVAIPARRVATPGVLGGSRDLRPNEPLLAEVKVHDGTAVFMTRMPTEQALGLLGKTVEVSGHLSRDPYGRWQLLP
jgi:hypothetical protein